MGEFSFTIMGDFIITNDTQANLVIAGYDLGVYGTHGVDGKQGPLTTRAIKSFQESIGLKPAGALDQETSRALDLMTKLGMTKSEIEGMGKTLRQDNVKIDIQLSNVEFHGRYPHIEIPGGGRLKDLSEARPESLQTIQGYDKEYQLDYRAVKAYNDKLVQAYKDGINPPLLQIVSGYRGDDYQKRLYDQKFQEIKEKNKTWSNEQVARVTRKWVAPPGGSPHRTGRAIDLYLGIGNQSKYVEIQRKTEVFQ